MLFDLVHLPYWIFLGLGVFLLLLVILSGGDDSDFDVDADADLDLDFDFDVDLDLDADLDMDVDADADMDADGDVEASSVSGFLQLLSWLGVGKAPLMLLLAIDLSSWGIVGWMLSVMWGNFFGAVPQGLLARGVLFLSLVIALYIGAMVSRPLGKVFAEFGEDASSDRLIGCLGTVSSIRIPQQQEGRIGQVDVIGPAKNQVTVEAVTPNWSQHPPERGQQVVVIGRNDSKYAVILKDSPDWQRWLSQARALPK